MLCPATAMSQGSAQTQVNIIIAPAQSITVTQPTVSVQMTQAAHYVSGNSSGVQADHVRVTSTTGYQVTVRSQAQFFTLSGSATTLPVSTLAVQTTLGTDFSGTSPSAPAGMTITPQTMLSTTATTIVNTPTGEASRGFNVNYAIPSNQTSSYLNRTPGTYSTTVTYSLIPL